MRRAFAVSYMLGRKLVVAVVGTTVVLIGVAMIALPGPAMLVIPLGLALLAAEFAWARSWLERLKRGSRRLVDQLRSTA